MNLPNALTVARIALMPPVALLPFVATAPARLAAFVLFVAAGLTDYLDGRLARSRRDETDLGKLLDPLADKLLLVGTLVPMYWLARTEFPFGTPWGRVGLPLWIALVILGREAFMAVFRQAAARRTVVIAAIGPAKWKTGMQLVWQGAAYFWFFAATLAASQGWEGEPLWRAFAQFNGIVGVATMVVALVLTVYSLGLYLRRYGEVLRAIVAGR
ncbi:MAG: CDP-alcohol phosphatidyltransferase family protein [Gemmatimonadota bacterium]|nr:CDP-alcohol phosphatidyltransferase family protein [Gemmatimonadota bacterium]